MKQYSTPILEDDVMILDDVINNIYFIPVTNN